MPEVQYAPEDFPGLVYRLKKPKTATLIFNTGNMVCTGAKSEKDVKKAVGKIVKSLNEAGYRMAGSPTITIQNVVGCGSLGRSVDLERAVMTLKNSMYEPEQFPGLIYRMRDPKNVVLIFGSGKFVIVGAKSEKQVPEAARILAGHLQELDLMQNLEAEGDA